MVKTQTSIKISEAPHGNDHITVIFDVLGDIQMYGGQGGWRSPKEDDIDKLSSQLLDMLTQLNSIKQNKTSSEKEQYNGTNQEELS